LTLVLFFSLSLSRGYRWVDRKSVPTFATKSFLVKEEDEESLCVRRRRIEQYKNLIDDCLYDSFFARYYKFKEKKTKKKESKLFSSFLFLAKVFFFLNG
jgi:hypothetical protein